MKKLISLIVGISVIFTTTLSFASCKVEPESEPDGYIVVYSVSKTKVVTQQDETNCAVSNWAFLTAYTMGANIVLAGVTILLLKAMVQILECTVIGKLNLGTRLIGAI